MSKRKPIHFTMFGLPNDNALPYCGGSWMNPPNFRDRLTETRKHVTCKNCRAWLDGKWGR